MKLKILKLAKKQILSDMEKGIIPEFPKCFGELHDYVDANKYGGFLEDNYQISENFEVENNIQNALDNWLKNRYKKYINLKTAS